MSSAVELKVETLCSQGFVQGLSRLAECRSLPKADFAVVLKLAKITQAKINEIKEKQATPDADINAILSQVLPLDDCNISMSSCFTASLSPGDVLALGGIITEG